MLKPIIREDVSPIMRNIISGIEMPVGERIKSILGKGSIGYSLELLLESIEKGELSPFSLDTTSHSLLLSELKRLSNSHNINADEVREIEELTTLDNKVSVAFGNFQLTEAQKYQGVPSIQLTTRGKVNVILGTPN